MPPTDPPAPTAPPPDRAAIRAYLDSLTTRIADERPPDLPSVLISGAIRCGKTRVARQVCNATRLVRLETDHLRNALILGLSERDKRRVAKYVYRQILLRHPRGLLIDGTALMDAPCELPLWARRRGILFLAIGYSEGRVPDKTRDLLAFRASNPCWTHKMTDDAGVKRLARQIIQRSKEVREFCAAHELPYFHLDSGQFDAERDRVAREIESQIRRHHAQTAPSGVMARLISWRRAWFTAGDPPAR
ncbi:MAG: hypothetical protein JJU09_04955 [Rhodobacteraceae bacterium]|nr:hypothetical protein [Paracoccaceae bacterium]